MSEEKTITVGICAHNEEKTIGQLLEQIMEENIPVKDIIVIVAGDDRTADIVSRKSEKNDKITLIEENERKGQIIAQNKILSLATGNSILLLDGDGFIKKGSLEALNEAFDGNNIAASKEVPVTRDSFLGNVIDVYGEVHHHLCLSNPRFSTHMGIFPSELVDSFPEIVLDDVYIENQAMKDNIPIKYVPEAVKYHNTPNNARFFFHQQKKNWAGRFEAEEKGYQHSKPQMTLAKVFLQQLGKTNLNKLPYMIPLAGIELAAYLFARFHQYTGKFPVKWWRPS